MLLRKIFSKGSDTQQFIYSRPSRDFSVIRRVLMDIPIYTLDGGDPECMLISLFLIQNCKDKIQNYLDRCPQYTYDNIQGKQR